MLYKGIDVAGLTDTYRDRFIVPSSGILLMPLGVMVCIFMFKSSIKAILDEHLVSLLPMRSSYPLFIGNPKGKTIIMVSIKKC